MEQITAFKKDYKKNNTRNKKAFELFINQKKDFNDDIFSVIKEFMIEPRYKKSYRFTARRVAATETEAATEIEAHPDRVGLVRTRAVCRVPCALLERMLSITAAPHRHRRRRRCCCYGRRTVQLLRVAQGSNGTDQDPHRADVEADVDEQLPFLDDSQPLEPPRGA